MSRLRRFPIAIFVLCAAAGIFACREQAAENARFQLVAAAESGIDFENKLVEDDSTNIIQYLYAYNGGGVAVADLNGDSLPDVYFSSNQGDNQLYINEGNFKFRNATKQSGLAASGNWKTGVSMADVNGDGRMDVYVCAVGGYKHFQGRNQLYINLGNGLFEDQAAAWGVDVSALSTQAAFFDYDQDNDLDMFLLCHSVHSPNAYRDTSERSRVDLPAADRLFRNDGGHFTDVSSEAGILQGRTGYGLGVAVADFNNDLHPDIFVGNDFHDNDYLYINQGNGKFVESSGQSFGHSSYFSMGCEAADINNDGFCDLLSMDMKPDDETVLKTSEPANTYNIYRFKLSFGYLPQFPRNALQINLGFPNDRNAPRFSEQAQLYGIGATDWSWSALAADFDNDGFKDVHITNGILRRPNDMEFMRFLSSPQVQQKASDLDMLKHMPDGKVSNLMYQNKTGEGFTDVTKQWGLQRMSLSNGAAYADLDLDGDLDLVVNNLNEKAFLYRNQSNIIEPNTKYLQIGLQGPQGNSFGVGAQVRIWCGGQLQYQEMQMCRGFLSSVPPVLHFGCAQNAQVDSVQVIWPDGAQQNLSKIATGKLVLVHEQAVVPHQNRQSDGQTLFKLQNNGLDFGVPATPFIDNTESEKLLPYLHSTRTKCFAYSSDSSNKQLFYFGDNIVHTLAENKIQKTALSTKTAISVPDAGACFFDADRDGDQDIYTIGGFTSIGQFANDRLYLQEAERNWRLAAEFPRSSFGSTATPWDFDTDGDLDIFVANFAAPNRYGIPPPQQLIENKNNTWALLPAAQMTAFNQLGLLTDAKTHDIDQDGTQDLVLCGHWMPVGWMRYHNKSFQWQALPNSTGLWNTLALADIDGNGKTDIVAGNLGKNHYFNAFGLEKTGLQVADFDQNGQTEAIISYSRQGQTRTLHARDELAAQMPLIKKRFPDYLTFSRANVAEILPKMALLNQRNIDLFESTLFLQQNDRTFTPQALPQAAQWSPVNSIVVADFDQNGQLDVLLAGNQLDWMPLIGKMDAQPGVLLLGQQGKPFRVGAPAQTGLWLSGQTYQMQYRAPQLWTFSSSGLKQWRWQ